MRLLVVSLIGCALVVVQAGYLPAVGPAPLRFRAEVDGAPFVLPPLAPPDPPFVKSKETNTVEAVTPTTATPETNTVTNEAVETVSVPDTNTMAQPMIVDTNGVLSASAAVTTNVPPAVANPPVFIAPSAGAAPMSPQMLLQFFRDRSGSNTTTTIVAPVGFTPPAPAIPPSSTATFNRP